MIHEILFACRSLTALLLSCAQDESGIVLPSTVNFGEILVARIARCDVQVENRTSDNVAVRVQAITPNLFVPDFDSTPNVMPGESVAIAVYASPLLESDISKGQLGVTISRGAGHEEHRKISVTGRVANSLPEHLRPPGLVFEVSSIELGDIVANQAKEFAISMENNGSSSVIVDKITSGCRIESLSSLPFEIKAGDKKNVSFAWHADGRLGYVREFVVVDTREPRPCQVVARVCGTQFSSAVLTCSWKPNNVVECFPGETIGALLVDVPHSASNIGEAVAVSKGEVSVCASDEIKRLVEVAVVRVEPGYGIEYKVLCASSAPSGSYDGIIHVVHPTVGRALEVPLRVNVHNSQPKTVGLNFGIVRRDIVATRRLPVGCYTASGIQVKRTSKSGPLPELVYDSDGAVYCVLHGDGSGAGVWGELVVPVSREAEEVVKWQAFIAR